MGGANAGGRGKRRLLVVLIAALVLIAVLSVGAQSAWAYSGWVHQNSAGTVVATCGTGPTNCHPVGGPGTDLAAVDAKCETCHSSVTAPRTGYHCWSCHRPGPAVVSSPCNGCHLYSGSSASDYTTAHSHPAHVGSNLKACTICHNLATDNPHHSTAAVSAPTCTTCHSSTPVDGSPIPHGAYVDGVTCSTCHKGVDPTHPLSATVVTPTLAFVAVQPVGGTNVTLAGTLKRGTTALVGVVVHLQSTPNGTDFTDITPVTPVKTVAGGGFTYTIVGATSGLSYRAVAEGVAGSPVTLPAVKTATVTAPATEAITLKLGGLTLGAIKLGKSVTAKGVIAPKLVLSQVVKLTVQKRRANGTYATVKTLTTKKTLSAYSKLYKPGSRGTYRVIARLAKTALHSLAVSPPRTFKVK